jgi:hypothetical protein
MLKFSVKIYFIFFVLKLNSVEGKIFTVCELVQELDDLHTIPQNEIYKHLCIVGSLIHTNKTQGDFLGLYRIGQQW